MATTSIVQLTADLAASTASGSVSQLMPSGTVLPFAGVNVPSGWLACDGREVSKATYPDLYASLAASVGGSGVYDTQINPTSGVAYPAPAAGNFRLPDYRGLFLRGTGAASGGDATTLGGHQAQKTAKNGLSVSTSVSGAKNQMNKTTNSQNADHGHGGGADANGNHSHTYGYKGNSYNVGAGNFGALDNSNTNPSTSAAGNHGHSVSVGGQNANHGHFMDYGAETFSAAATSTTTGDNETRPVNRGINYIIKV